MVLDFKKPYRARVVLWSVRRRKPILRTPVDELGAKLTVATDIEVKEMLFEYGDMVVLEESMASQLSSRKVYERVSMEKLQ